MIMPRSTKELCVIDIIVLWFVGVGEVWDGDGAAVGECVSSQFSA